MERVRPTIRFALYAAAASGAMVSALLLLGEVRNLDEPGAPARAVYFAVEMAFYGGLAIFAGRLCEAQARRAWMGACAFVSLAVALLGAWPGTLALSAFPTAVLLWLAVRGKLG